MGGNEVHHSNTANNQHINKQHMAAEALEDKCNQIITCQ